MKAALKTSALVPTKSVTIRLDIDSAVLDRACAQTNSTRKEFIEDVVAGSLHQCDPKDESYDHLQANYIRESIQEARKL